MRQNVRVVQPYGRMQEGNESRSHSRLHQNALIYSPMDFFALALAAICIRKTININKVSDIGKGRARLSAEPALNHSICPSLNE